MERRMEIPLRQARARLQSATELLGEREERLLELEADVADVKALYRDQIEFMVGQLAVLSSSRAAPKEAE